jgi:hypothetical protein
VTHLIVTHLIVPVRDLAKGVKAEMHNLAAADLGKDLCDAICARASSLVSICNVNHDSSAGSWSSHAVY